MKVLKQGMPYPLGSTYVHAISAGSSTGSNCETGVNFAIFSAHAEKIELCIFDNNNQETRFTLPGKTHSIWHGFLPHKKPNLRYGYRVYGLYLPAEGLLFNPQDLLIDPYARMLDTTHAPIKSVVVIDSPPHNDINVPLPRIPWGQTIIYEAHVKGLTARHPEIPKKLRGTYAALAHPVIIDYLQKLGITTLELMPVQMHIDEPRLQVLGLKNYWGYSVLAPFAVEPRYWSKEKGTTPLSELRNAVSELHKAGIEVILDVVFNHTAELDQTGPRYSLRGIDNKSYYWLKEEGDRKGIDLNYSGCGNTINCTHPQVIRWIADCLRYWITECNIDGFRFDLGTILGRTYLNMKRAEFSPYAALFAVLQQDPLISRTKLIFEPWDVGPNGYQLGNFPAPFAEWNDKFRDTMRRFWLKKSVTFGEFTQCFAGSSDYFKTPQRAPSATINMITAHDGFTLRDLVSFNQKHNEANGENNQDGNNLNYSNNHGIEGHIIDNRLMDPNLNLSIQTARYNMQRTLLATLLLSHGTPMLLSGDELGHSQQGNNNAYCQDNEITWINWQQADLNLYKFVSKIIKLRKEIEALNNNQWWFGLSHVFDLTHSGTSYIDVKWLDQTSKVMSPQQFDANPAQSIQILLSEKYLIIININDRMMSITLPKGEWSLHPAFTPKNSNNPYLSTHEILQSINEKFILTAPPNTLYVFIRN